MIHPCPNCGQAYPMNANCANHSYIVTNDVTPITLATPDRHLLLAEGAVIALRALLTKAEEENAELRETMAGLKGERDALQKTLDMLGGPMICRKCPRLQAALSQAQQALRRVKSLARESNRIEMCEVCTEMEEECEAALPSDAPEAAKEKNDVNA